MSLREFMFAADALRQEKGVEFTVAPSQGRAPEPSPADNRARNQQAMSMFQSMMGGVQKRKRR